MCVHHIFEAIEMRSRDKKKAQTHTVHSLIKSLIKRFPIISAPCLRLHMTDIVWNSLVLYKFLCAKLIKKSKIRFLFTFHINTYWTLNGYRLSFIHIVQFQSEANGALVNHQTNTENDKSTFTWVFALYYYLFLLFFFALLSAHFSFSLHSALVFCCCSLLPRRNFYNIYNGNHWHGDKLIALMIY